MSTGLVRTLLGAGCMPTKAGRCRWSFSIGARSEPYAIPCGATARGAFYPPVGWEGSGLGASPIFERAQSITTLVSSSAIVQSPRSRFGNDRLRRYLSVHHGFGEGRLTTRPSGWSQLSGMPGLHGIAVARMLVG
jgi:hypothetical protein